MSKLHRQVELNSQWDSFKGLLRSLYGDKATEGLPEGPDKAQLARPLCSMTPATSSQEFAAGAAAFLFRKVVPAETSFEHKLKAVESYIQKVSQEKLVNPVGLAAIDQTVKDWFKPGWDKRYVEFCETVRVSQSACLERTRKDGGARAEAAGVKGAFYEQEYFFDAVINGRTKELDPMREIKILVDSGKFRLVTVATALQCQLLPLHLTIYDHMSRKCPWLLVGDALPEKFVKKNESGSYSGLTYKKGFTFVSGDYESATDNFNSGHSEHTLSQLQRSSSYVPDEIWEVARRSMTGEVFFEYEGKDKKEVKIVATQSSGQMMGNYLSFPLLCIINASTIYLAWPDKAKQMLRTVVKINGDDIVFQCPEGEEERWFKVVSEAGLVLSRGKTLVHPRYWSLNSTFFRSTRRIGKSGVVRIPVVRAKTIFPPPKERNENPHSYKRRLAAGFIDRLCECVKPFQGVKKRAVGRYFNQANRRANVASYSGGKIKRRVVNVLDSGWRRVLRWGVNNPALYRMRTIFEGDEELNPLLKIRPMHVKQDKQRIAQHLSTVFQTLQGWDDIREPETYQLMDRVDIKFSHGKFGAYLEQYYARAKKVMDAVHIVKEKKNKENAIGLPEFLRPDFVPKTRFVAAQAEKVGPAKDSVHKVQT